MPILSKCIIPTKPLETVVTRQYTASSTATIIDRCVLRNRSTVNVTVSIALLQQGTEHSDVNCVFARVIRPGETVLCQEVQGQVLNKNDSFSTLASTASAVTIRVSGREVSV